MRPIKRLANLLGLTPQVSAALNFTIKGLLISFIVILVSVPFVAVLIYLGY